MTTVLLGSELLPVSHRHHTSLYLWAGCWWCCCLPPGSRRAAARACGRRWGCWAGGFPRFCIPPRCPSSGPAGSPGPRGWCTPVRHTIPHSAAFQVKSILLNSFWTLKNCISVLCLPWRGVGPLRPGRPTWFYRSRRCIRSENGETDPPAMRKTRPSFRN